MLLEMLEAMLEAMLDIDPSSAIGPKRKMQTILRRLLETNHLLGRRLREVQLPVDWPKDGLYEAGCKDPCLTITYRPTGACIVIAGRLCTAEVLPTVTVENNFSKMRAQIVFKNGAAPILIAMEFMRAGLSLNDIAAPLKLARNGTAGDSTMSARSVGMPSQSRTSTTGESPAFTRTKGNSSDDLSCKCGLAGGLVEGGQQLLAVKEEGAAVANGVKQEGDGVVNTGEGEAPPPTASVKEELTDNTAGDGDGGAAGAAGGSIAAAVAATAEAEASFTPEVPAEAAGATSG